MVQLPKKQGFLTPTFRKKVFLLGMVVLGCYGRLFSQEVQTAPTANRWAVILDILPASGSEKGSYELALQTFQNHLIQTGIAENQVLLFSCLQSDEKWHPTRKNIQQLLTAFRNPEQNRMPCADGRYPLRRVEGIVELHVYVLAKGFSDTQKNETFLVPSPVSEKSILEGKTKQLITLESLEEAMLHTAAGQKSIERTLLVVDFQSMFSVTRGNAQKSPFQETNLRELATRGYRDEPEAMETASTMKDRYLHLRIYTKNHSLKETSSTAFYQTLRRGLEGYADIAGNQDGIVQAEELARYLRSNHPGSVEVTQNGNDSFPLCKAHREVQIPEGLFQKLARTLTRFPEEQQSARKREIQLKAEKKRTP